MAEPQKAGLMLFEQKITVAQLLIIITVIAGTVSGYINITRQIERLATNQQNQTENFNDFRREVRQELRQLKQ